MISMYTHQCCSRSTLDIAGTLLALSYIFCVYRLGCWENPPSPATGGGEPSGWGRGGVWGSLLIYTHCIYTDVFAYVYRRATSCPTSLVLWKQIRHFPLPRTACWTSGTLQEIHDQLYSKSLAERDSRMASIDKWEDILGRLKMRYNEVVSNPSSSFSDIEPPGKLTDLGHFIPCVQTIHCLFKSLFFLGSKHLIDHQQ